MPEDILTAIITCGTTDNVTVSLQTSIVVQIIANSSNDNTLFY